MIKKYNKIKETLANLKKLEELTTNLNVDKGETLKEMLGIDLDTIKIPTNKPKIPIKFINKSDNKDPYYSHEGDSGFDFRAFIKDGKNTRLSPSKRLVIPTGLYFEIPSGYELQARPRSGLALKYGITVLNTPGTIDSNYRGEVGIILINLGDEDFIIENGDRIAQGVIASVLTPEWSEMTKVNKLSPTTRNDGGFGSTGKK